MRVYVIHYEDLGYDNGYVGHIYTTGESIQDARERFIRNYPTCLIDSIEEKV